jgi:hypothetical protein
MNCLKIQKKMKYWIEDIFKINRRTTAHNRTVCTFGRSGGSVRLGRSATLHSHGSLHPQFVGPKNATHFLVRAAKPSHTTETLCEIAAEIVKIKKSTFFCKNHLTVIEIVCILYETKEKSLTLRVNVRFT